MKNKRFPKQATLDFDKMPHGNRRLFCGNILDRSLPESAAWKEPASPEFAGNIRAAVQTANAGNIIDALEFKKEKQRPGKPLIISAGANRAAFALAGDSFEQCACSLTGEMSARGINWGIITDGATWRLYNGTIFSPLENYYETDLPFLLTTPASPDFNYFRLFFSSAGFVKKGGKPSFIDGAMTASKNAVNALVENLRDAAELAALDLCRGFIRFEKETTGATPEGPGLDMIYRHSLLLLYRLLYILLAEAWGALPARDAEYYKTSLTGFAAEAAAPGALSSPGSPATYSAWPILERIFDRARRGDKNLNALPQCGELFCPERHKFLLRNKAGDHHIQLALARIVHTERDTGARFADLHPARAADILRRLPEMRLQIAKQPMAALIEKDRRTCRPAGDVKSQKIVEQILAGAAYIEHPDINPIERPRVSIAEISRSVERRLAPVAGKAFAGGDPEDALRSLSIFDPVCGPGASLMAAAEYLARRACPLGKLTFQQYKRIAAESAVYGADPDPLMAETARIVISLFTATADLPPPVIEHRIAAGNALFGVSVKEISDARIPSIENLAAHIKTELARIAAETVKAESTPALSYGVIRRKEGTLRRLAREQAALAAAAGLVLESQLAPKPASEEIVSALGALAADPTKFTHDKQPSSAWTRGGAALPLHIEWTFPALFSPQNGKSAFSAALITAPSAFRLDKPLRDFASKRLGVKGRLIPADALSRAIAPYIAPGGVISALSPASFSRSKRSAELAAFIAANYKNTEYRIT